MNESVSLRTDYLFVLVGTLPFSEAESAHTLRIAVRVPRSDLPLAVGQQLVERSVCRGAG